MSSVLNFAEIFRNSDSLKTNIRLESENYLEENENNLKFVQPSNLNYFKYFLNISNSLNKCNLDQLNHFITNFNTYIIEHDTIIAAFKRILVAFRKRNYSFFNSKKNLIFGCGKNIKKKK